MINIRALFSDETQTFKTPYEPCAGDTVTIRIRTLKNDVLKAYAMINGAKRVMEKYKTDGSFDWFGVSFKCPSKPVKYYFRLVDEDDTVCYNRLGGVENSQPEYDFSFVPGQKVPEMTPEIVKSISDRYIELFEHVTGQPFVKAPDENLKDRIAVNVLDCLQSLSR